MAFVISFLVISIDDEYGEEGDDDYEAKHMGAHGMNAMNELIKSTGFVKHANYPFSCTICSSANSENMEVHDIDAMN